MGLCLSSRVFVQQPPTEPCNFTIGACYANKNFNRDPEDLTACNRARFN